MEATAGVNHASAQGASGGPLGEVTGVLVS